MKVETATKSDANEILDLQKVAYLSEAKIYDDYSIPPLVQTVDELMEEFSNHTFYVVRFADKIIASISIRIEDQVANIGRLIVSPEKQGAGIGGALLDYAETANPDAQAFELFTGHKSEKNLAIYHHKGYQVIRHQKINDNLIFVHMRKLNRS